MSFINNIEFYSFFFCFLKTFCIFAGKIRVMKRLAILFLIGVLFFLSCQNNKVNIELAEIDTLIVKEQYDSAYYLLNKYA